MLMKKQRVMARTTFSQSHSSRCDVNSNAKTQGAGVKKTSKMQIAPEMLLKKSGGSNDVIEK